jgi:hypothetical protein
MQEREAMVKLVIMIEFIDDWEQFFSTWPEFLHLAEAMPGLQREASSRIEQILYGDLKAVWMHELFFDSSPAAQVAMASLPGQAAGRLLQQMTGGRLALFFADTNEDDLENIRRYQIGDED